MESNADLARALRSMPDRLTNIATRDYARLMRAADIVAKSINTPDVRQHDSQNPC